MFLLFFFGGSFKNRAVVLVIAEGIRYVAENLATRSEMGVLSLESGSPVTSHLVSFYHALSEEKCNVFRTPEKTFALNVTPYLHGSQLQVDLR